MTRRLKCISPCGRQIANRYKKYSDRLIFEGANEELGDRLNDTDVCKNSGSLSKAECYEMANKINQTFVDTVRATGGTTNSVFFLSQATIPISQ